MVFHHFCSAQSCSGFFKLSTGGRIAFICAEKCLTNLLFKDMVAYCVPYQLQGKLSSCYMQICLYFRCQ